MLHAFALRCIAVVKFIEYRRFQAIHIGIANYNNDKPNQIYLALFFTGCWYVFPHFRTLALFLIRWFRSVFAYLRNDPFQWQWIYANRLSTMQNVIKRWSQNTNEKITTTTIKLSWLSFRMNKTTTKNYSERTEKKASNKQNINLSLALLAFSVLPQINLNLSAFA